MKILKVYNQYRSLFNGEEAVVFRTLELLRKRGNQADLWMRSSRELQAGGLVAKARAFWSGIYSREAYLAMREKLTAERPDVVHAHNIFPLFSPSIFVACRDQGVPVVLSIHNQNLTCPKADHLYRGAACERCFGGKEYHCVLRNCRQNILESVAYAMRSAYARRRRLFLDNVTRLIALTDFARQRLLQVGFGDEQVVALPNMIDKLYPPVDPAAGNYVSYAGRMSPEKGVGTLLEAARLVPQIPFRLAGTGPCFDQWKEQAPENAALIGRVEGEAMPEFYRGARMLVLASTAFEMCPLVISEAMSHGIPVVAARIGGVDELVDDGVTGLLFEPGNPQDLARKVKQIWEDPALARTLGESGHQKAEREYGEDAYYAKLISIYREAIGAVRGAGQDAAPGPANAPASAVIESASCR